MDPNKYKEIEVRFLEIDPDVIKEKLRVLGAQDLGEDHLEEIVFYDQDLKWQTSGKEFVRLRENKDGMFVTYKYFHSQSIDGAEEIELRLDNFHAAKLFLERVGLVAFREQEKRRHTFKLDGVTLDIDWWPAIPPYIELEGESEQALKDVAAKLGFDWQKAVFENARDVIQNYYKIPVSTFRIYRFDRME